MVSCRSPGELPAQTVHVHNSSHLPVTVTCPEWGGYLNLRLTRVSLGVVLLRSFWDLSLSFHLFRNSFIIGSSLLKYAIMFFISNAVNELFICSLKDSSFKSL